MRKPIDPLQLVSTVRDLLRSSALLAGGSSDHIAAVLRERRPGLVVIDSFKALRVLAYGDAGFRQFLHQLAGRLSAFPVASLWVGEYESGEAATSPEFAVADAIVELAAVPLGQREHRFLHVRKLRGSGFLAGQHGYRLTTAGLRLFPDSPTSRPKAATRSAASGPPPACPRLTRCWAAGCGQARPR